MKKKWIAVVTRVDARVFAGDDFRLITKLKNALGREKNHALTTDKPGLGHGKFIGSSGFYSLSGEKNPHEDAAKAFAKRVGAYLEKQLNLHHFDELLIAAEPKMLGRLKGELNKEVSGVTSWKAKDFGKLKVHELRRVLQARAKE